MRQQLRAGTLVLALFGSGGFAIAQTAPGSTGAQEKFNLSQPHEQMITQGLRSEPSQSAPGYRGDVGSKLPDSMTSKALPDDVTAQVPATKTYLFVKLPDRILLIDPTPSWWQRLSADRPRRAGRAMRARPAPVPRPGSGRLLRRRCSGFGASAATAVASPGYRR
ncbi:MAG: hypothetical protein ACXU9C_12025 [Xanthobacteraceae bacterium]